MYHLCMRLLENILLGFLVKFYFQIPPCTFIKMTMAQSHGISATFMQYPSSNLLCIQSAAQYLNACCAHTPGRPVSHPGPSRYT